MVTESKEKKRTKAKIVLLGENSVGKTSIIKQYMGQGFRSSHLMTIGTDFDRKWIEIDENNVLDVQIWDLASQVAYENLRKQKFLTKASGAMIIFDLTRYETFIKLSYWLKELFTINPKSRIPILFVGNKRDLNRDRVIPTNEIEKYIQSLKSDRQMSKNSIYFTETSAKSGENVDYGFSMLAHEIAKNIVLK